MDPVVSSPRPPAKRVLPPNPRQAAVVVGAFVALLYVVQLVNSLTGGGLVRHGILPLSLAGLDGVLWAPLLHGSWPHLLGNTVPVLVLAFLAMSGGFGQFAAVTGVIWLVGGLGTWVTGGVGTAHVGASGLIFGWLAFLLVRGILNRALGQVLVSLVLFFVWGGMLWGVLPTTPGISWQGHLFGAIGGLLAAWFVARANSRGAGAGTARPRVHGGSP
ncbi:rhomboid family intramembrane serine protease [Actinoalloteichus sp. AHMU CJ021]|nr:rhomboid family intramembrane serine protease [Actinoalloteichus sp. AHMU CJ021]